MAALVAAIHGNAPRAAAPFVDARLKAGHDGGVAYPT
jgi:hypothetical protein